MSATTTGTDRWEHFVRWFVRNPETGEVQVLEPPNRRIKALYALRGSRAILHWFGLAKGTPVDRAIANVTDLVLLVWALDEMFRGRSPFRRTAGAISVLWALRSLGSHR